MTIGSALPATRTLLTGLVMGESPRWHGGRLWFCDWGVGDIISVGLDGRSEVMAHVDSLPLSIDWLPDGRLLAVASREGRLLRQEADGTLVTHAELSAVSTHPWNEIVVDATGRAYVNSIGFEMMAGEAAGAGFIVVVGADGVIRRVADGLSFPNGMAITADGSTLLVAESYGGCLSAFDIGDDGALSNQRIWAAVDGSAPDGICLDVEGAAWFADVPNQRCVRVAQGGEVLQTIDVDRGCFACALGGSDGRTLFVLAANWAGPDAIGRGDPSGVVLTADVSAARAGKP
ncbi:MAG: SMP-30/gluconolactonase/LRE family protein [Acidimicrobiia bacterium]